MDRHFLGKLSIPKKAGNTILTVSREQVLADLEEINSGQARRVVTETGEVEYHTKSGRVYGTHDDVAYPKSGPGTTELSSPQYNTLRTYQDQVKLDPARANANMAKALDAQVEKGVMTEAEAEQVRDLGQAMRESQ